MTRFVFDAKRHKYFEDGVERPHITGMLLRCGLVDDRWYTDESSVRGQEIHALTAGYDLGSVDPQEYRGHRYRGYLESHVEAMRLIPHAWQEIEETYIHPDYHFGGRPDRVGLMWGKPAVVEGKSTVRAERSHRIQTALQAILVAPKYNLPATYIGRFALYWRHNGKFKLEEHSALDDFREARRVIDQCCR